MGLNYLTVLEHFHKLLIIICSMWEKNNTIFTRQIKEEHKNMISNTQYLGNIFPLQVMVLISAGFCERCWQYSITLNFFIPFT